MNDMGNPKVFIIIIVLVIFLLTGCAAEKKDIAPKTLNDIFLTIFQSENLDERKFDIVSITEKLWMIDSADIINMNYSIERCNLSRKDADYCDDLIIAIDILYTKHGSEQRDKVICAFVTKESNNYRNVFLERYNTNSFWSSEKSAKYERVNITGDEKNQIELITIERYPEYTTERMQIFSYTKGRSQMSVIFNEIISSDLFFSYKAEEENKYRIKCENDYEFVPVPSGGSDILLRTRIYEREHGDQVLENGSTRFTYNGTQYVPSGTYYDYQIRAQSLCDGL